MTFIIDDSITVSSDIFPTGFGRGYVERDYSLYPEEMFQHPSEMTLIPESEWKERIEEQEKTQSSLEHIRMRYIDGGRIPSLDQDGQGYCHSSDTEVLTENGWVLWPDYKWDSRLGTVNRATGRLEFQYPLQKHVYEYKGEMIHSTNRRINFSVTPDHGMYVRQWNEKNRSLEDSYSFVRADDIGWYCGLMASPRPQIGTEIVKVSIPDDREYDGDEFLELISVFLADGYVSSSEDHFGLVSFCCFDERYERLARLASRTGFIEQPSRKGVWKRHSAHGLSLWLRENCYDGGIKSVNKRVPDLIKRLSPRQIGIFLDSYADSHRTKEGGVTFFSSSKRMADDIQELLLRSGVRSSIGKRSPREVEFSGNKSGKISSGESYCVYQSKTDRLHITRKKHIEKDRYDGLVYCAGVPNGTLVTRNNGTVLVSSNCWAYSTTMATMLVRARANLPYVRLSAHAVGCKVKNFRDEGGWCGLSAQFLREKGVPSVEKWPEKSMSRQYDNEATWLDAARYKTTEDWVDLTRRVYDQNLTFAQVVTCLLNNIPCALDFNWWGHSVCGIRAVNVGGEVCIKIINSWTDQWGENGMGVLKGSKKIPNGAVAIRVVG